MHVLVSAEPLTHEQGGALGGELVVLALRNVDPAAVDPANVGRTTVDPDTVGVGPIRSHPDRFVGVDSHAEVATVEVVDLDVSPHVAMSTVVESLARRGPWDDALLTAAGAQLTAEMLSIAAQFPVGTVMRMEGSLLHAHVPVAHEAGGRRPVCDPGRGGEPPE